MSKLKPFFGIMRVPIPGADARLRAVGGGCGRLDGGRIDGLQVALLLARRERYAAGPTPPYLPPFPGHSQ